MDIDYPPIFKIHLYVNRVVCLTDKLQKHKWENCMTIDRYSWGYRRNAVLADYLSIEQLISQLAQTVRCCMINMNNTLLSVLTAIFQVDLG